MSLVAGSLSLFPCSFLRISVSRTPSSKRSLAFVCLRGGGGESTSNPEKREQPEPMIETYRDSALKDIQSGLICTILLLGLRGETIDDPSTVPWVHVIMKHNKKGRRKRGGHTHVSPISFPTKSSAELLSPRAAVRACMLLIQKSSKRSALLFWGKEKTQGLANAPNGHFLGSMTFEHRLGFSSKLKRQRSPLLLTLTASNRRLISP
jgi:hypothetical protein